MTTFMYANTSLLASQVYDLPSKRWLYNRFQVLRTLGTGGFGEVLLVQDTLQDSLPLFAIKCMRDRKGAAGKERSVRIAVAELSFMRSLSDPAVVRVYDAWYEPEGLMSCLLLEYCSGGDLGQYLERNFPLSEWCLIEIITQCLLAVGYLHRKDVVHRDLKLLNFMVDGKLLHPPRVKIGDFGLAARLRDDTDMFTTGVGTVTHLPPEAMVMNHVGKKGDVWSLGIALYQLMTFELPFRGNTTAKVKAAIVHDTPVDLTIACNGRYSQDVCRLVMSMLNKNVHERPTVHHLLGYVPLAGALTHYFWTRDRQLSQTACMFVCRKNVPGLIYSTMSRCSTVKYILEYGEHVYVEGAGAAQATTLGAVWVRVVSPVAGYCLHWAHGYHFLQFVGDPRRCPPVPDTVANKLGVGGEGVVEPNLARRGAMTETSPSITAEERCPPTPKRLTSAPRSSAHLKKFLGFG